MKSFKNVGLNWE